MAKKKGKTAKKKTKKTTKSRKTGKTKKKTRKTTEAATGRAETAATAGAGRYRILSLDGGGIRGIMTAVWLARLEKKLGGPLREHFELVAGTSTGSILACAISNGMPAAELIDGYRDLAREVFPRRLARLWSRATRLFTEGPSAPKYDDEGLESALRRYFGDTTFGELEVRPTLVTSYNALTRQAVVFKNTRERYLDIPVWEIVKASSSAPSYFPAHVMAVEGVRSPLIDGGVVANNPTACAIAEGVRIQSSLPAKDRVVLEDFVVASFGTGEATRPISISSAREWGAIEWSLPIIDVLFDGSADAVDYIAHYLTGEDNYFRFQSRLDAAYDDLDNADETNINALLATANDYLDSRGGDAKLEELAERVG